MVAYAKRMRRHKIKMQRSELPVGTHLLLSGMLLTINGVVYDIGFPGWMTNLVPKESERSVRPKLARRANSMKRERDARMQNLSPGWWLKRPKEEGSDVPAMERLVGPVAYRGRAQQIQRKSGRAAKPLGRSRGQREIMSTNLSRKEFLTTQLDQRDNRVLPGKAVLEGQVEIIQSNLDSKGSKAEWIRICMIGSRGDWKASPENLNHAQTVLEAVTDSGTLYRDGLGMIASENIVSPMVQKIVSSDLHGRYAEGLPYKRYYQGCGDFDTIEELGINLAKKLFNVPFANIQSTSGTVSNIAALKALAKPGDDITAVSTADGGHISHARMGAVGLRDLNLSTYPWDEDRMEPDIDASAKLIREVAPKSHCLGNQYSYSLLLSKN